jgi:lipopolysaccharide/colanic/teichoic acid biosynthesis glycosyltransferase
MTPSIVPSSDGIGGVLPAEARVRLCPSAWCTSLSKRIFDVIVATILLIAALPIMLLASLAVFTSPGPLFFASDRVGQRSKAIRVLKFRTMRHRKQLGIHLTRRGDARVTKAGRFLRKWKIDELPQFINVLRGDMSLVGPRPDAAEFLNKLQPSLQSILSSIKPGVTSVATQIFRNEEELLSDLPESELTSYYVGTLLPEKVWIDLQYASCATMFADIKVLLQTLFAIFH